jgi:sortase A
MFVGYQLVGTSVAEQHSQSSLAKQFNAAIAAARARPAPTPTVTTRPAAKTPVSAAPPAVTLTPTAPAGGAVDHLVIPKIGVDKFVVLGINEDDLRRGPGLYPGTVLPGQNGNAGIAGHRTTYGAPFFRLNDLSIGDPIYITDLQDRTFIYKVSEAPQVVSPDDVAVLDPTTFAQLTLTTCNPRFSATSRLVVFARLSGRPAVPVSQPERGTSTPAQPAPAPTLAGVDNLGSGNHSAWPAAILYGAIVLLLWIGVRILINRSRRWTRLAVYVVGIGICLVPLWFCFENTVLLLPQSI